MPTRHILHDVPLDFLVFQDGHSPVYQDRRRRRLEIRAEVRGRFLHVDCGHLQADRLQFSQEVQVHEVLLAEETGPLSPAIDCGSLQKELELTQPYRRHLRRLGGHLDWNI